MDVWVSGPEKPPKCPTIIYSIEPGKPYVLPMGSMIARSNNGTDGLGIGKKRMVACNGQYKGKIP